MVTDLQQFELELAVVRQLVKRGVFKNCVQYPDGVFTDYSEHKVPCQSKKGKPFNPTKNRELAFELQNDFNISITYHNNWITAATLRDSFNAKYAEHETKYEATQFAICQAVLAVLESK